MDHIGFGLSDKPTDWTYTPEDHARNFQTFVEALKLTDITLVVQDWGGPIGLSYALDHPGNVRRVVILNTWMWPVNRDAYYVAFSRLMGGPVGRLLIRRFNFFARVIMPSAYGDRRRLTPGVHAHYLRALGSAGQRRGCWVFPGRILASTPWLGGLWERRAALRGMPAHIVWGMKDIAFREKELNTWTATLPEADVTRLPDVGHFVQDEAPDALGAAVERFLA
jgi:haloalkane dehalogenase